jgi:hypothetical protein
MEAYGHKRRQFPSRERLEATRQAKMMAEANSRRTDKEREKRAVLAIDTSDRRIRYVSQAKQTIIVFKALDAYACN